MAKEQQESTAATTYTREALAASKKYRAYCDVLMITLDEGKEYTLAEADKAIAKFTARPVVEAVNE